MPCMKFLFVRSDVCRQLPSDSTSRWTPLLLAMQFPLLGLARDFHPLDNAHAERTKKRGGEFLHLYPQKFGDLQMYTLNKFCERLRLLDCKDTHF